MDPKKIITWCAVPAAIIAMWAAVGKVVDVRAQDAAVEAAAVEVEQRMAPVEQQLEILVEQGKVKEASDRRSEDREELAWCLDRLYQDLDADVRARVCDDESDARWVEWARQDTATSSP